MDILNVITNTIRDSTIKIVNDDFKNVKLVKKTQFKVTYLIFSIINYYRIYVDTAKLEVKETLQTLVDDGLLPYSMIAYYNENIVILMNELRELITEISNNAVINATNLYQELLSCDIQINSDKLTLSYNNTSRNILGSYYTPQKFAFEITKKALDSYFEKQLSVKDLSCNKQDESLCRLAIDLLGKSKIADLSCGGGDFFLSVIDYTKKYLDATEKDIISITTKMYGIDVDPIALQLALCNLLLQGASKKIINNFYLGNPLLFNDRPYSMEEKLEYAASYRSYNKYMGMDLSKLLTKTRFDIILGNPPWEKVRLEEKKFFQNINPDIANISNKAKRTIKIEGLRDSNSNVYDYYCELVSDYGQVKKIIATNTYLEKSLKGELNTYVLFTELAINLLSKDGIAALVLKAGIATLPVNAELFRSFVDSKRLKAIYSFSNKKKLFKIDSRERFCVMIFESGTCRDFLLAPGLTEIWQMANAEMIKISSEMLEKINPTTGLLPNINDDSEISFLIKAHNKFRTFQEVFPDCRFGRIVHLTTHASNIRKENSEDRIPVYEGKFIEQYDGRYSTFEGIIETLKYRGKSSASVTIGGGVTSCKVLPEVRFYINKNTWLRLTKNYTEDYSLMWRSLTSSTNTRTMIATILPHMPTCQSIQLLQTLSKEDLPIILALFNSVIFDYFVRLKLSSIDLTQAIIKQVPVPEKDAFEKEIEFNGMKNKIKYHILDRVATLYQCEDRLENMWVDIEYTPNILKGVNSKKEIMSQLDFLLSVAYDIDEKELKYIAKHFKNFYTQEEVDLLF